MSNSATSKSQSRSHVGALNIPSKYKQSVYYVLAALASLLLIWLGLGIGFGEWSSPVHLDETIWQLRYPRVVTALLVGMALSVSGAALQALFENPLADPSLIGTSGGAALGVVLVLAFGVSGIGIPFAAFMGSVIVCLFILGCHRFLGGGQMGLLILGFVISAFCAAVVSLILFMSDDMVLRSATNWLSGSMAEAGFVPLRYSIISMVLGLIILLPLGRQLDGLMLGETTAKSLGIKVGLSRCLAIIASALLTGAAVSLAGVIGFIGMMVPNLLAILFGGGRMRLMIWSGWLGAMLLLVIDSMARHVAYPIDVPVSIVLALLGGPFFIWLFVRSSRR
ncbi:iron ABC transporter permease [uncultured Psychrobacter sp.]|jgi:iron complex transport system permease protein|uniref:FecCD family ABC transporter permease n=1 Tax=uncultured Psychrobacter sp. TaxID=259303 RepID=UPI0026271FD4|nr:iron ABC transporter permease [uncultured Psychrobacter sp.]